ncbi:hypothetical protein VTO73DRAFT_11761 [Trametes versicolor]
MKKPTVMRALKKATQQAKPAGNNGYLLKQLKPQNLILYADKSVVAINKPRGLVCQPSRPITSPPVEENDEDLMSVALRGIREALFMEEDLRVVHRLDKQTSGFLLLARTHAAARDIARQMQDRSMQKTYLALVCGEAADFPSTSGTMDTQLICENGRIRVADGPYHQPSQVSSSNLPGENWVKQAITEYRVLASSPTAPISLLELNLVTGLKHQIRAQLAQQLGTPILGDIYGPSEQTQEIARMLDLRRIATLCLHSSRLTYTRYARTGPLKKFRLGLGAPIPSGFDAVCKAARIELDIDQRSGGVWLDNSKVRGVGSEDYQHQRGINEKGGIDDAVTEIGGVWYGDRDQ